MVTKINQFSFGKKKRKKNKNENKIMRKVNIE